MNKFVKKALCIVMALVLTMSLCACSSDPNCGSYVCKTVTVGDITVNVNEAFETLGRELIIASEEKKITKQNL